MKKKLKNKWEENDLRLIVNCKNSIKAKINEIFYFKRLYIACLVALLSIPWIIFFSAFFSFSKLNAIHFNCSLSIHPISESNSYANWESWDIGIMDERWRGMTNDELEKWRNVSIFGFLPMFHFSERRLTATMSIVLMIIRMQTILILLSVDCVDLKLSVLCSMAFANSHGFRWTTIEWTKFILWKEINEIESNDNCMFLLLVLNSFSFDESDDTSEFQF